MQFDKTIIRDCDIFCNVFDNYGDIGVCPAQSYRALFKAHDEEIIGHIRNATNGNFALGSERFQKEIEAALGRRARRGQAGRPTSKPIDETDQLDLL